MDEGLRGKVAVVGAVDVVSPTGALDEPAGALQMRVVREALEDAGLSPGDVDGVATTGSSMKPNARHRDPITIDDVLGSPSVASPFHVLDCCVVTDGAGAVVLARADRAKDLRKPPVLLLGAGTSHTHSLISQMPDLTRT